MGLQDLIARMLPREERFFDLLEEQAGIAHDAAQALATFTAPDRTAIQVRDAVQIHEHRGDEIVHRIEEALAKTFVTPIDREDIHLLATKLDDVIDLTNYAARACAMLGVPRPSSAMAELMRILVEATTALAEGLPALRTRRYSELLATKRRVRDLEKEGDIVHREAITALFHDDEIGTKVLLRDREVLEDLENAIDRCEMVADTLANLAVKHG